MGDELGSATDTGRLLVSSGYTNFHVDREIWSCHTDFVGQKRRQKWVILVFLGYLGEFESDSQTIWTSTCGVKPRSVLPIFHSQLAMVDELRL